MLDVWMGSEYASGEINIRWANWVYDTREEIIKRHFKRHI